MPRIMYKSLNKVYDVSSTTDPLNALSCKSISHVRFDLEVIQCVEFGLGLDHVLQETN